MTNEEYQEAVWRFWEAMNNDISRLGGYSFAPDYKYNGKPATAGETAKGMKEMLSKYKKYLFTKDELFGEGQKVALRWTLTATLEDDTVEVSTGVNMITFNAENQVDSNWQVGPVVVSTTKATSAAY